MPPPEEPSWDEHEAMEAVRYRSDAVYSKLAKHHSRWGGLVADEISKHFGGDSHLAKRLEVNEDGEVTWEAWRDFVEVEIAERGVLTVRFFLNHLERSIELHHGEDEEQAILEMFHRGEEMFNNLQWHHGSHGGVHAADMAMYFGGDGSSLFRKLDRNHDGEVTLQDFLSYLDSLRMQNGVKSCGFFLSHIERTINLHHYIGDEAEVAAIFHEAEALYNDLEGWHATEEGLLKKDIGDYFDSPDDWEIWSLYDVLDETLEGHVTMEHWMYFIGYLVSQKGTDAAQSFMSHVTAVFHCGVVM